MASLQKFLQNGGTLDYLEKHYFLIIRRHKEYNNLVLFKYSQTKSPFNKKIVQESRGIILDENDNWKIISYPYNKFFNYGEKYVSNINWNTSIVYEKVDGCLMTLYYYNNKWNVSSSGIPDASGNAHNYKQKTFKDVFWDVWNELNYQLPQDITKCYIFELLTPNTQIIVQQHNNNIILHGIRCLLTYKEEKPDNYKDYGWNIVKNYKNFNNIEEILENSKTLDPLLNEGYVICDNNFNRCKIKGIEYIKIAHSGSKLGNLAIDKNILKIILENESSEVLSAYPQYKDKFDYINTLYNKAINDIEHCLRECNLIKDRKKLAEKLQGKWYSDCIFKIKYNKGKGRYGCVTDWLADQKIEYLMQNLKKYQ